MHIHLKPSRRALTLAYAGVSAVFLSIVGLADGHEGHSLAASTDPAQHAEARSDDYKRSLRSYAAIPDVVLTDTEATPVRLRVLLASDDPVMLNFIFTTCSTICPVMTKVFSEVPARLGADAKHLRMVSISIDPENDTPAQLRDYARKFEAGAHWKFLSGSVQDVIAVQRAFGSYNGDKMSHQPLTLLRAAPGKPWVRIDGFASADQLASEYRKLLLN